MGHVLLKAYREATVTNSGGPQLTFLPFKTMENEKGLDNSFSHHLLPISLALQIVARLQLMPLRCLSTVIMLDGKWFIVVYLKTWGEQPSPPWGSMFTPNLLTRLKDDIRE